MGATATGKTAFALALAEAIGGEIVSVDSMQVYRGMDIGTAKASVAERRRVAHHLVDVADPDDPFDARRFADLATEAVTDIARRGRRPLLVGGTGLWLKALVEGLMPAPPADDALRARLQEVAGTQGTEALHKRLQTVDPVAADRIHPRDGVRAIRALEVHELTGRPISEHHREHRSSEPALNALSFGLTFEREALHQRIDARTEAMWAAGFVEEVRGLIAAGYSPDLRPMGALGYKHVCAALSDGVPPEEAMRLTQRDTRRYAKRQRTWFQKDSTLRWLKAPVDLEDAVPAVLRHFEGTE